MKYAKAILLVATLNMTMSGHAISDSDNCFPSELKEGGQIKWAGTTANVLEIDGCWIKLEARGDSVWIHATELGSYQPA